MKRLPTLPVLLPAAALALVLAGCSGFGDFLLHPGGSTTPPVAEDAAPPQASRAQVLADETAAQQNEALTAALDRLNATQARLQVTLEDLQKDAAEKAQTEQRHADETQASRRSMLVASVAAVAALLIALLLAVIVVRQSSQVRRAVRALAQSEADMEEQLQDAAGVTGRGAQGVGRRGGREASTASGGGSGAGGARGADGTRGAEGPRGADGARGSDAGAGGSVAPGSINPARLRKRPPVG
jgi:hypothetical protein